MIKFFRNIRKSLINQGKTSKYLKYAIGEIILVVIGILIALQINNWNQEQKDHKIEITYLKEIQNSLQSNNNALQYGMDFQNEQLEQGKILLEHLKNKRPLNDTILKYLSIPLISYQSSYNTAAFENFKSEGLPYISNDSLKLNISFVYEGILEPIFKDFPNQMENMISNTFTPFYMKNFEFESLEDKSLLTIPNDYGELIQQREMSNIVSIAISMKTYVLVSYKKIQEKILELIDKVDAEIKKLENT